MPFVVLLSWCWICCCKFLSAVSFALVSSLHLSARGADAEQSEQWAWLQPRPCTPPPRIVLGDQRTLIRSKKQKRTLMANGNPAWKATTCEMIWLIYTSQCCHFLSFNLGVVHRLAGQVFRDHANLAASAVYWAISDELKALLQRSIHGFLWSEYIGAWTIAV